MQPVSGLIVSLDVGKSMGFASGMPGDCEPRSFSVKLGRTSDRRPVVAGNLIAFLDKEFRIEKPALVFKEMPLVLGAFLKLGVSDASVRSHYGLHCVIEGMCARFGVPWHEEANSRIRKHFIGKAHLGKREDTKRAVLSRCIQLGYLPRGCEDDNRADALAGWDWASVHLGRKPPSELHFYGERSNAA